MATLRYGIAGIGNEGQQVVPYIGQVPGAVLTAVADVRADALEAFRGDHPDVATFQSVDAMCQSSEVDAVWIATPNELHAEHVIAAARHGKHIVLEKPMALTLEDAEQMVQAAEANAVQLVMHSHASDPPIAKMREVIASGRLGRLIGIHTWSYKGWLRSPRLAFEVDTARGGGVVFRQGPHQIEIVRRIGGGLVKKVRAYTGRWHPSFTATEGNYTALLEFDDGTPATLVFNGYGHFSITDLTWDIGESGHQGSGGYRKRAIRTGPVEPEALYRGGRRGDRPQREPGRARQQPIFGLTLVSCERGDLRQSPDGVYVFSDEGCEEIACEPYLDRATEVRELCAALVEERPAFPDGRWGMATLEVVLAILQSSKEGREVALSHQVAAPS